MAAFSALALCWLRLAHGLGSARRGANWRGLAACALGPALSLVITRRVLEEYEKFRDQDIGSIDLSIAPVYSTSSLLSVLSAAILLRREVREWFGLSARLHDAHDARDR